MLLVFIYCIYSTVKLVKCCIYVCYNANKASCLLNYYFAHYTIWYRPRSLPSRTPSGFSWCLGTFFIRDYTSLLWLSDSVLTLSWPWLVYKSLNGLSPQNLADNYQLFVHNNRPPTTSIVQVPTSPWATFLPRTHTSLGDRSFTVAGLRLWNNLSLRLRTYSYWNYAGCWWHTRLA